MKKIIGIFMCMLLFIPLLSSSVIASSEPNIEIGNISGHTTLLSGAVLTINILNTGNADANDVIWNISLKHPLFKKLNFLFGDTIDFIKAGDMKKLSLGLTWCGRFELTVSACIPGGMPVSKTVNGFSIFIFIILFSE